MHLYCSHLSSLMLYTTQDTGFYFEGDILPFLLILRKMILLAHHSHCLIIQLNLHIFAYLCVSSFFQMSTVSFSFPEVSCFSLFFPCPHFLLSCVLKCFDQAKIAIPIQGFSFHWDIDIDYVQLYHYEHTCTR